MSRRYVLECADGTVWDFNDPACPVSFRTEPTGTEGAEFTHDDQKNVGQAGVSWVARNDMPNFIGLDCKVGPVPKADALRLGKLWRHSLGRGKEIHTFWSITETGGEKFQYVRLSTKFGPMDIRLLKDSGVQLNDPATLRSDETWWRKRPAVKTFKAADFATAAIESESDEPVWPHIVITGPITLPKIGWQGELVPLPTIAAGDVWTINTDPNWFSIKDGAGNDRSWIARAWYKQIPGNPASPITVPITIQGTGTNTNTSVKVTLPQLFREGF
nr:hypothetical protein [Rhodococcus qingshengii]